MQMLRYAVLTAFCLSAVSVVLAQSASKKSFELIKAMQGTWEGKNSQGQVIKISMRSTAGGSAVLHETLGEGSENMITMFHLDGDRLMVTHYCGAGNQPRMKATPSADGKTLTFEFVDATNLASPEAGHMNRLVLTVPDANHHTEEWTYIDHGKEMKEVFTLSRKD